MRQIAFQCAHLKPLLYPTKVFFSIYIYDNYYYPHSSTPIFSQIIVRSRGHCIFTYWHYLYEFTLSINLPTIPSINYRHVYTATICSFSPINMTSPWAGLGFHDIYGQSVNFWTIHNFTDFLICKFTDIK
jgi:hypothetical protein